MSERLIRRIRKELQDITSVPVPDCSIQPIGDDLTTWQRTIHKNQYQIKVKFPDDYPFKPMKIQFLSPIDHSKIDSNGNLDIPVLNNNWSPAFTISKICNEVNCVLSDLTYRYGTFYKNRKEHWNQLLINPALRKHPVIYYNEQSLNYGNNFPRICYHELSQKYTKVHRYDCRHDHKELNEFIIFIPEQKSYGLMKTELMKYCDEVSSIGDIICDMVDPYYNGFVDLEYFWHGDAYGESTTYNANIEFYYKHYPTVKFGVKKYTEGFPDEDEYRLSHDKPLKEKLMGICRGEKWSSELLESILKDLPELLWVGMDHQWAKDAWNHKTLIDKR